MTKDKKPLTKYFKGIIFDYIKSEDFYLNIEIVSVGYWKLGLFQLVDAIIRWDITWEYLSIGVTVSWHDV